MSMSQDAAERSVTTSAVVVAGIYAYRRLIEQSGASTNPNQASSLLHPKAGAQLAGVGGVPPLSHFIVGFGFAYLMISALAEVDPQLGGTLAILLATGAILANGVNLFSDLTGQLKTTPTPAPGAAASVAGAATPLAQVANMGASTDPSLHTAAGAIK